MALLAYGTVTNDALKAADMLARSGVSATVVDMRYAASCLSMVSMPVSMPRAHKQAPDPISAFSALLGRPAVSLSTSVQ